MNYNHQLRHNLENQIISSLLNENDLYFSTLISLKTNHFKNQVNKSIYLAIQQSAEKFKEVDLNTVSQFLVETSSEVSIQDVIRKLSDSSSYKSVQYDNLAKALLEYSACDTLTEIASGILGSNKQEIDDIPLYLQYVKEELNEVSTIDIIKAKDISEQVDEAIDDIHLRMMSDDAVIGLPTSIPCLDDFTSGWLAPDLIIVAATPGSGKTAFAIHSHLNIGIQGGVSSYYSYEVTVSQLLERQFAILSQINSKKFLKGDLNYEEFDILKRASSRVKETLNHHFSEQLSLSKLISSIRYNKIKHDTDIVFIDYCQLIDNDIEARNSSKTDLIGGISTRLKQLAIELKMPIVLLSQLSREVIKRPDKKPINSDLRGSGSLEQDADIILFLHRPELYSDIGVEGFANNGKDLCQGFITKGRKIGTGEFNFHYDVRTNVFKDWD